MKIQALGIIIVLMLFPVMSSLRVTDSSTNYSSIESMSDSAIMTMQTAVKTFVDDARYAGEITKEAYDDLIATIDATGYSCHVEIVLKELEESDTSDSNAIVIGENFYTKVESSDIIKEIQSNGVYKMEEGDILSCSINNGSDSSQSNVTESDIYNIVAQHSGIVVATAQ